MLTPLVFALHRTCRPASALKGAAVGFSFEARGAAPGSKPAPQLSPRSSRRPGGASAVTAAEYAALPPFLKTVPLAQLNAVIEGLNGLVASRCAGRGLIVVLVM